MGKISSWYAVWINLKGEIYNLVHVDVNVGGRVQDDDGDDVITVAAVAVHFGDVRIAQESLFHIFDQTERF